MPMSAVRETHPSAVPGAKRRPGGDEVPARIDGGVPPDVARAARAKTTTGGVSQSSDIALSLTDEALLTRMINGDGTAGEALVDRYAEPLLRYLRRLVGDDLAEELHQQTWVSVLENLEKFDSTAAAAGNGFKAWLYRIATNKANDLWRSRGREKAAKQGLRLITETDAPWAGEAAQETEQQQKLLRAIERLPEPQRQILALRYYTNMKFVDIAKLLGCPLNTALGRVHKAILKLRELMGDAVEASASRNQDEGVQTPE
jgi:RNA polymerase sigma-70 factor (ECF subfamily)